MPDSITLQDKRKFGSRESGIARQLSFEESKDGDQPIDVKLDLICLEEAQEASADYHDDAKGTRRRLNATEKAFLEAEYQKDPIWDTPKTRALA